MDAFNLSESVLVESKAARDGSLSSMSNDRACEVINKAKALAFASWKGTGLATTAQMAEFYESSIDTVRSVVSRHKDEFEIDGLREVKGKELKALAGIGHESLQLPESTTRVTTWTPRAALRLGMILRDSDVAKQVRNVLLDVAETVPVLVNEMAKMTLQNENLKLENENLKLRNKMISGAQMLDTISPGLGALALGDRDAVVHVERTVEHHVIVDQSGQIVREHKSLPLGTVAKQMGMKQAKDLEAFLISCERQDLIQEDQTIIKSKRIDKDAVREIRKLWGAKFGDRQKLIGE